MPLLAERLWRSVPFVTRYIQYLEPNLENVPLVMGSSAAATDAPQLTPNNLFEALSNGLLLAEICEKYQMTHMSRGSNSEKNLGGLVLRGIHRRPMTKRVMLKNLEMCLVFIWQRNVSAKFMCTPIDFFLADAHKVFPCLLECMEVWIFRHVRTQTPKMLHRLNSIMKPYRRQFLPDTVVPGALNESDDSNNYNNTSSEAQGGYKVTVHPKSFFNAEFCRLYPLQNVVSDFADGIVLAIVLCSLGIADENDLLTQMIGQPRSKEDYCENLNRVISVILRRVPDMPLLLKTPSEWCRPPIPCPETLLTQLDFFCQAVNLHNIKQTELNSAAAAASEVAARDGSLTSADLSNGTNFRILDKSIKFADGVPLILERARPGSEGQSESMTIGGSPYGSGQTEDDLKNKNMLSLEGASEFEKTIGNSLEDDLKGEQLFQKGNNSNNINSVSGTKNGSDNSLIVKRTPDEELVAAFEFLGPKCSRNELREALGLTSFARTLLHKLQISPGEILQIADHAFHLPRHQKGRLVSATGGGGGAAGGYTSSDTIDIPQLLYHVKRYLKKENRFFSGNSNSNNNNNGNSTSATNKGEGGEGTVAAAGGIKIGASMVELTSVYQEDLRRHYELQKDYYVIDEASKAKFLQQVHPDKRSEWNSVPTLEVQNVHVSFLHHFQSFSSILCTLYTTVVACKGTYRFLLIVRDQRTREILMKIDVGNVQVMGFKIRVFSRTSMAAAVDLMSDLHEDNVRRKTKLQENLPEIGGKVGGNSDTVPTYPSTDLKSGTNKIIRQFESGKSYVDSVDEDVQASYLNSRRNGGFGNSRDDDYDNLDNIQGNKGLEKFGRFEELLEEELTLSCPESSQYLLQLQRFLEELRLISYFLPPREPVPGLGIL